MMNSSVLLCYLLTTDFTSAMRAADALDVVRRDLVEWTMLRTIDFYLCLSIDIDGLGIVVIVAVNLLGCFNERFGRVLLIFRALGAAVPLDMIAGTNSKLTVIWTDDGNKVMCCFKIDL